MHSDEEMARLVAAVRELDPPKPRERRWVSVSFCVLDAVYSIGAHYDNHVVPVVERVAADFEVQSPSVQMSVPETADPVPLDVFLDRYTSVEALLDTTKNRQNTSTRGGIRKADAALRYATVLHEHGVLTLNDARRLLTDTVRLDAVEAALRQVPGEGSAGVRRGYLWMLIGGPGHSQTRSDGVAVACSPRRGDDTGFCASASTEHRSGTDHGDGSRGDCVGNRPRHLAGRTLRTLTASGGLHTARMSDRVDEELAMLSDVCRYLRSVEGQDFSVSTAVVDRVLDERNETRIR